MELRNRSRQPLPYTTVKSLYTKGQIKHSVQSNKNLLLANEVEIDTCRVRNLCDDVKCAHGATIGELDEDAELYLQSRGIPEKDTINHSHAFAEDIGITDIAL